MKKALGLAGVLAVGLGLAIASPAHAAADAEVVYETTASDQGWTVLTKRGLGGVSWTTDGLQLSTPTDPAASSKITFGTTAEFDLADLSELEYAVKHVQDGSNTSQRVAINLFGDWNGPEVDGGDFILVYEPVYNNYDASNLVAEQTFDAYEDGGANWWTPTSGVPGFASFTEYKTMADIQAAFPDATIRQLAVNQGGGNNELIDVVKSITLNGSSWVFKKGAPVPPPVVLNSADECKKDGWKRSDVPVFKNQGACVSFFASAKKK